MRTGTYSIAARDAASGELGVAVQSHWFSVGSVVSWASPGAGAVATQSVAEVAHGPDTLALMRGGLGATVALETVLERDPLARVRQLGAVDPTGAAAAHTGAGCIPHASHLTGEAFTCQANMMARRGVPEAMAEAYEGAGGELSERLLAALDAAENAGGDVRGRQSAALRIVPPEGEEWRARLEIRVEDHPQPLRELRRLLTLARAYEMAARADELVAAGEHRAATELYLRASELAPDADELTFWAGLGVAEQDLDRGVELVRRAAAKTSSWLELLARLPPEFAPTAHAVAERLQA